MLPEPQTAHAQFAFPHLCFELLQISNKKTRRSHVAPPHRLIASSPPQRAETMPTPKVQSALCRPVCGGRRLAERDHKVKKHGFVLAHSLGGGGRGRATCAGQAAPHSSAANVLSCFLAHVTRLGFLYFFFCFCVFFYAFVFQFLTVPQDESLSLRAELMQSTSSLSFRHIYLLQKSNT